jgi:diacylglycerol kinase
MAGRKNISMKKTLNAFVYAFNGLKHAYKNEKNFRIEICCAAIACAAGFLFRISDIAWLIILLNIGLVLSAELFNTVIERLCDLYSTEIDPRIKVIKDGSAAAVLVTSIVAAVIAAIIFIPALVHFIKTL